VRVADALDSLQPGTSLHQHILLLPQGAPAGVFDLLSGEVHASAQTALLDVSRLVQEGALAPIRNWLGAGYAPGAPTAQAGGPAAASSLSQSRALPLWVDVVGRRRQVDGDANAAAVDQSQGGLFMGATGETDNRWTLGVAAGYIESRQELAERRSSVDVRSYSLALATGKRIATSWGGLNLLGGMAHTWHELESTRDVVPAGLPQTLEADRKARTLDLFGELGLVVPVNPSITAEPFMSLGWTRITQSAFEESGGTAALRGAQQDTDSSSSTLGLRMQKRLDNGGWLQGSLGWRQAHGDYQGRARLSFPGSQPFTVTGAAVSGQGAVVQLGARLPMGRDAALHLDYGAQFGNDGRDQGARITFNWRL
jgi:outer membrane autotransporter protein